MTIQDPTTVKLEIKPVTLDDLPRLSWTGSSTHQSYMRQALKRYPQAQLLAGWLNGEPICVGAIDLYYRRDRAYIWMLATHPEHRGKGHMQRLIKQLENLALIHHIPRVELNVEETNRNARRLYAYLGYVPFARVRESWIEATETGEHLHACWCVSMCKDIPVFIRGARVR